MKKTSVNLGYTRDKILSEKLGVRPVPYSGSRWDRGTEDGVDEDRLFQFKSTDRNALSVAYSDLHQLREHAQVRIPVFVLDFVSPAIRTNAGILYLPEEQWIMVPLEDYLRLWTEYTRKERPIT